MKIEDIHKMWALDAKIDGTELSVEALRIPSLHSKYFVIFTEERLRLRKYETDMKKLKLEKHEFFTQGPTQETMLKGWQLPPVGKVIKSEVSNYIDADDDIIHLTLRIGIQQEKIELLDSVIRSLNTRGFLIKSSIDWEKFKMGQ
mgnify:CR=1 FL=1|tara:strand:- start:266 stop:700 length:435 start_codon:yes stop_codon:yes gene_type:complete